MDSTQRNTPNHTPLQDDQHYCVKEKTGPTPWNTMGTIQWIRCTTYQETTGKCIWSVPLIATGCIKALPAEAGIPYVSRIRSYIHQCVNQCCDVPDRVQTVNSPKKNPNVHCYTRVFEIYMTSFLYILINLLLIWIFLLIKKSSSSRSWWQIQLYVTQCHKDIYTRFTLHSLLNIVDTFTFEIWYSSFLRVICCTIESPLKNKEFCPFSQIA